jgi:cystathionine gamma-lyase
MQQIRSISKLFSSPLLLFRRSSRVLSTTRHYSDWKPINADFDTLASSTEAGQVVGNHGVAPIATSSFFVMDSAISNSDPSRANEPGPKGYEYSRLSNPSRTIAEDLLSKLEGAKYTRTFASGMAAISAVVSSLQTGDHVISMHAIYNATLNLLNENANTKSIKVDYAKGFEVDDIVKHINSNTKLILIESQVNPTLEVVDIAELVKSVRKTRHGQDIKIAVDNTFLTPIFLRPLELGVDIVIHSCTKYLSGHGDIIMGSVSTNCDKILAKIHANQIKIGAIPSPFDCYLLTRSLRTLPLRMKQHSKNGLIVAQFLESHPMVEKVLYAGLPSHPQHAVAKKQQFGDAGMVGFYIRGDIATASRLLDSLKIFKRSPSLGTYCSLASLPAKLSHYSLSQTHRDEVGILDNFLRLSVGLEGADSLIEDLDQAIRTATR